MEELNIILERLAKYANDPIYDGFFANYVRRRIPELSAIFESLNDDLCAAVHDQKIAEMKLAKYKEAEVQGRLAELPLPKGSSFFEPRTGGAVEYKIMGVDYYCMNENGCCDGKSVNSVAHHLKEGNYFLTREEAEAALERLGQE